VSHVLNRIVPAVPVPLFQVALGALLALGPVGIHLELDPELFFVLFVAPLLFNDGKRTPRAVRDSSAPRCGSRRSACGDD
jgi:NhaP-type Na+/H+ or K+/H+ antiporter